MGVSLRTYKNKGLLLGMRRYMTYIYTMRFATAPSDGDGRHGFWSISRGVQRLLMPDLLQVIVHAQYECDLQ